MTLSIPKKLSGGGVTTLHLVRPEAYTEIHYTVNQLSKMWARSANTIRRLVCNEPGVMKLRIGPKQKNITYSIPASVAERIHMRLSA